MTEQRTDAAPNRLDRRKARTRAALVRAAQTLIADRAGRTCRSWRSPRPPTSGWARSTTTSRRKEELFEAAVEDVLDAYGAAARPAHRRHRRPRRGVRAAASGSPDGCTAASPSSARSCCTTCSAAHGSDNGLAPRARRDIEAAARAGRFTVRDLDLALSSWPGRALPRPAAARPPGARRRRGHRPGHRGPAAHVRRRRRRGPRDQPAPAAQPRRATARRHGRVERFSRSSAGGPRSWRRASFVDVG